MSSRLRVVGPLATSLLVLATLGACGDAGDVQDEGAGVARDGPSSGAAESLGPPPAAIAIEPLVDDPSPPAALWRLVEGLRTDRDSPRAPSDGGGRAWLVDPEPAVAGAYGRWTIVFETGELGVAVGGAITLQTSPFWRWSPAWVDADGAQPDEVRQGKPGFTTVATDAEGVALKLRSFADGLVVVGVEGRALRAGEQVTFVYGAGAARARADDFAEHGSAFYVGVDGDGDGVRSLLAESPAVDVLPGPAQQVVATLTSVVAPDGEARLTLAVLDALGNRVHDVQGEFTLAGLPAGATLPERVTFSPEQRGALQLSFRCPEEGVQRVVVQGPDELLALSNPMVVQADAEPILWGDLHGHSAFSDGTGTPADWFAYARDVAALDVAALTDHDHWGFRFLDSNPAMWDTIAEQVEAYHEPGRFVTLLGYEWTSWIHGHRHVLSFAEQPSLEVLSSLDERYETPRQLWDALRGRDVLTFAHHSAGGPIATNWTFAPDPELEPVTEVVSVHGSSEGPDGPGLIYSARAGNFVRDVLQRGHRLGFVGSGDGHDGHPGLAHLSNPSGLGGLVALLTADATRAGVAEALRQRRCYATSGARMVLRCSLGGARMGSVVPAGDDSRSLVLMARGTAPIIAVDVIRDDAVIDRQEIDGESFDVLTTWSLDDLEAGEFVYLRVIQVDGHMGFTSPFFVE